MMNPIKEGSLEEPNNYKYEFNDDSGVVDSSFTSINQEFKIEQNPRNNKCSASLPNCLGSSEFISNSATPISNCSQSSLHHLSLRLINSYNKSDNQLELTNNNKSISKLSLSPSRNNKLDIINNLSTNNSPTQTRKPKNLKQRLRRFNSSIENRLFNNNQTNHIFTNNKTSNKIQTKNEDIIDEAKQSSKFSKNDKALNSRNENIKTFVLLKKFGISSNKSCRSMSNLSDRNNLVNDNRTNSAINFNQSETEQLKKALYKIEVPRDAVKTSLKSKTKHLLLKDSNECNNYLNSLNQSAETSPNTTTKIFTTTSTDELGLPTDVTTTTITTTTKTIIKLSDIDRKKNISKRRNTISTIALNNNNNKINQSKNDLTQIESKSTSKIMANELNELIESNIFEIIENDNVEYLVKKLILNSKCVDETNEYDFTPLDLALMLNNKEIVNILIKFGAIENPSLCDWNDRYDRICSNLTQLNKNLRSLLENFNVSSLNPELIHEYDLKLEKIDNKIKLFSKMKNNYEKTDYPNEVRNVVLEVYSPNSLMVSFEDPINENGSKIIKYMIEWSSNSTFEPVEGQIVLTFIDEHNKQYLINNLVSFKVYYVRVNCANIRGYGPFSTSDPPFAIPSYWRDGETVKEKLNNQVKKLNDLDNQINLSKNNLEFVNSNLLNNLQKFSKTKKQSAFGLKRNLKTIFTLALATANLNSSNLNFSNYSNINVSSLKFAKQIKKCTAYLVSVIYDGEKILTTFDDNLPMIEIDENYSFQNIYNDYQFLVKLSLNWNDIEHFKSLIEQTINTNSLRFRYLVLCVIKQMQNLLEMNDLGRVYYQTLKNTLNGSVFFVLIKQVSNSITIQNQNLKLNIIDKLVNKINLASKSLGLADNLVNPNTNLDNLEDSNFLFKNIKSLIDFDINCEKKLSRGLYIAFLKLQSSIELLKVMVPFKIPNMLPCEKVRDNPNVSREEWNLLKSIKYNSDLSKFSINELNSINFVRSISDAINQLCKNFEFKEDDLDNLRIITKEIIEVNEDLTLILICPSIEQTCIMQIGDEPSGQSTQQTKYINEFEYLHLPVQLFEAIHLSSYNLEFIKAYVKISIKLDIENLASNQFNREAFSNEEINISKKILNLTNKYQKQLEDIWKESRWLIECINNAREKNSNTSNLTIQYSDVRLFLNNYNEMKEKNSNENKCCKCYLDNNNNNIFNKKNIYNHITKLPNTCNCEIENQNSKKYLRDLLKNIYLNNFNHIDSVLIDDEDLEQEIFNKTTKTMFSNTINPEGSIEDLRTLNRNKKIDQDCDLCTDCLKNCNNCSNQINSNVKSSSLVTKSDQNLVEEINKSQKNLSLLTKLYISAPTTPTNENNAIKKITCNSYTSSVCSINSNSYNYPVIKENIAESPMSTASSSSGYYSVTSKQDSNLSSPSNQANCESWNSIYLSSSLNNTSNRKINVFVDFETGLKIDLNFECIINNQTTAKDVIYHIIKKINSFISSLNQLNQNFTIDSKNLFPVMSNLDMMIKNNSKQSSKDKINFLDENLDAYFLVIKLKNMIINKNNQIIEKTLVNNYSLSNLKEPWINGTFYLKYSSKLYLNK